MRRPKELFVLVALFVGLAGFVLWYVADRRARQQAAPPAAPQVVGPVPPAEPVDLAKADGKTIDFSSGKPVTRDSAEDQAALAAAKKEMDAALAETSFTPAPPPAPPKK